ncbi:TetR/AcrR family transcriptional regulator [Streptomyces sp. SID14478]|uniref:TetR/AcrR family transcriptional regulator C-terminal domain-containing protein n=1 Tax=Streptomyces sp. SID14478 TaxID=2706073 RepID=UPI0013DBAD3B|nr:TetR/AcrR family transcriptional regulator C-terminal domain-containing protein [Streptomyces sp. SID14478]NEB79114.1 TetR/AcrR family transcriptional regulator [Streptomyces sp. SID14478]
MGLKRSDITREAFSLLDAEGLNGLTMRRLAASLTVAPGALYWHFADKNALLSELAELLMADVTEDAPSAAWDRRVMDLSERIRAALLSRRDGARLVAGTHVSRSNTLRAGNLYRRAFVDAGLSPNEALSKLFSVFYFVLGFTVEEQAYHGMSTEGTKVLPQAQEDPELAEMAAAVGSLYADVDFDARFRDGLQTIIDGVRWQLAHRT